MAERSHTRSVLLVNPPVIRQVEPGEESLIMNRYWEVSDSVAPQLGDQWDEPNIGLLMLAAYLREQGYSVSVVDLHLVSCQRLRDRGYALSLEEAANLLAPHLRGTDVVGISALTPTVTVAHELARFVHETQPGTFVVAGGIYPSLNPDEFEAFPNFDGWIVGEGEEALADFLCRLEVNSEVLEPVPGMMVRTQDGTQLPWIRRDMMDDLSRRPVPAYDLAYPKTWTHRRTFRLLTAKGCEHDCSFCSPSLALQKRFRLYPTSTVTRALDWVIHDLDSPQFIFGDLTFFHSFEHTASVCEYLAHKRQEGVPVSYWCQTRCDKITEESAALLRDSGCRQVAMGIEVATQRNLEDTKKGFGVADTERALELLEDAGVPVQAYLMVGLPDETREDVLDTIDFATRAIISGRVQVANVAMYVPFPGIEIPDQVDIVDQDLRNYAMGVFPGQYVLPVYNTPHLDRYEIRALWELSQASITSALIQRRGR